MTGFRLSATDANQSSVTMTPTPGRNNVVCGSFVPNHNAALGQVIEYDGYSRPISVTLPNGAKSSATYDSAGRLQSVIRANGSVARYTCTVNPTTATETTEGKFKRMSYDGLGRHFKTEIGDANGVTSVSLKTYDPNYPAKVAQTSSPVAPGTAPAWQVHHYDELRRLTRVDLPNGSGSKNYSYAGNTKNVTDPAGRLTTYFLNAANKVDKVVRPHPTVPGKTLETAYRYDPNHHLAAVTAPGDVATQYRSFQRDAGGRLTFKQHAESGQVRLAYNVDGTLASKIDANSQKVMYRYDAYKRRVAITRYTASGKIDPAQSEQHFYDSNPFVQGYSENSMGRLAAIQWGSAGSPAGQFTEMYSYSQAGAPVAKRLRISRGTKFVEIEVTYKYDAQGRLIQTTYPGDGGTFTYTYDTLGRPSGLSQQGVGDIVKALQYTPGSQCSCSNASGLVSEMSILVPGTSDYYTVARTYNARSQVIRIQGKPQQDVPATAWMPRVDQQRTYQAGANDGRMAQILDAVSGESINYQYDSLGRLTTAATVSDKWGLSFRYDDFGNRTSQTVTKGRGPSSQLAFDPATNQILDPRVQYDANGNMIKYPSLTLTYDVENRLTQAVHSQNGAEEYAYDVSNRRVWRKKVNGAEEVSLYGYTGGKLAAYALTTDAQGNLTLTSKSKSVYFDGLPVYSGGVLVVRDSVNSVIARIGGASGKQAETAQYFPFGEEYQPSADDREKFNSYVRDSATGLDYAQNRYYLTSIGRFLTPDPLDRSARPKHPETWNRYAFVCNDPINYSDPLGLDSNSSGKVVWHPPKKNPNPPPPPPSMTCTYVLTPVGGVVTGLAGFIAPPVAATVFIITLACTITNAGTSGPPQWP